MFHDLDIVKLKKDYSIAPKGATGTVVLCYTKPNEAYEVEFFDSEWKSLGTCAVLPEDLELI